MKKWLMFIIICIVIVGSLYFIKYYESPLNIDPTFQNHLNQTAIDFIENDSELKVNTIDKNIVIIKNEKDIDMKSMSWLLASPQNHYDYYIRVGNDNLKQAKKDECYVELLYSQELDQIIAYKILYTNLHTSPIIICEE